MLILGGTCYIHLPLPSNDIMVWLGNTKFSNVQLWNFYFSKSNESKFKILPWEIWSMFMSDRHHGSELQPCLFSCMMLWLSFWINHIENCSTWQNKSKRAHRLEHFHDPAVLQLSFWVFRITTDCTCSFHHSITILSSAGNGSWKLGQCGAGHHLLLLTLCMGPCPCWFAAITH